VEKTMEETSMRKCLLKFHKQNCARAERRKSNNFGLLKINSKIIIFARRIATKEACLLRFMFVQS